jgi:hypothetical protein
MANDQRYDPQVYKRLELVEKQFQHNASEQKKQKAFERRQRLFSYIQKNKPRIIRISSFVILAVVAVAVIAVVILGKIS